MPAFNFSTGSLSAISSTHSLISVSFQGQFRSTVRCKTCGKKSVTFDVFSCLPLELTSQRACSLDVSKHKIYIFIIYIYIFFDYIFIIYYILNYNNY